MIQSPLINLHLIELDVSSAEAASCRGLLSPEERSRADRFATRELRDRWLAARAGLREILAEYCGTRPEAIRFESESTGKPILPCRSNESRIHFNLSHSGPIGAVAATRAGPIGVDVEYLRPIPDWRRVARRFFSTNENRQLSKLPDDERETAFYRCWTRKEAVIKATGEGLSAKLDCFDVSLTPDEAAAVLQHRGDPAGAEPWQLEHFDGEGFVGAVAIRARAPAKLERHGFWSLGNV